MVFPKYKKNTLGGPAICLGTIEDGSKLSIPLEDGIKLLMMHLVVIGSTGTGKSKWVESLLWQLARYGYGFCIVDKESKTSDDTLSRIASEWGRMSPLLKKELHYLHLSTEMAFSLDFFFTKLEGKKYDVWLFNRIEMLIRIIGRSQDLKNLKDQQRRQRVMRNTLYIVGTRRMDGSTIGLHRSLEVLDSLGSRKFLKFFNSVNERLPEDIARDIWKLQNTNQRDLDTKTESTRNILTSFLSPHLREVLSNAYPPVDFERIVLFQAPILVSIGNLPDEVADVLAAIIINCVVEAAWNTPVPYFCVIEEVQKVLGPTVVELWETARKHGVGLITICPSWDSLKSEKWDIRNPAISVPRSHAVFQDKLNFPFWGEFHAAAEYDFTNKFVPLQLHGGYEKRATKTQTVAESGGGGYQVQKSAQRGINAGNSASTGASRNQARTSNASIGKSKGKGKSHGSHDNFSDSESKNSEGISTKSGSRGGGRNESESENESNSINFAFGDSLTTGTSSGVSTSRAFSATTGSSTSRNYSWSNSKSVGLNEVYLAKFKTVYINQGLETPLDVQNARFAKLQRTLPERECLLSILHYPSIHLRALDLPDPFDGFPHLRKFATDKLIEAIVDSHPAYFTPGVIRKWQVSAEKTRNSSGNSKTQKRWDL